MGCACSSESATTPPKAVVVPRSGIEAIPKDRSLPDSNAENSNSRCRHGSAPARNRSSERTTSDGTSATDGNNRGIYRREEESHSKVLEGATAPKKPVEEETGCNETTKCHTNPPPLSNPLSRSSEDQNDDEESQQIDDNFSSVYNSSKNDNTEGDEVGGGISNSHLGGQENNIQGPETAGYTLPASCSGDGFGIAEASGSTRRSITEPMPFFVGGGGSGGNGASRVSVLSLFCPNGPGDSSTGTGTGIGGGSVTGLGGSSLMGSGHFSHLAVNGESSVMGSSRAGSMASGLHLPPQYSLGRRPSSQLFGVFGDRQRSVVSSSYSPLMAVGNSSQSTLPPIDSPTNDQRGVSQRGMALVLTTFHRDSRLSEHPSKSAFVCHYHGLQTSCEQQSSDHHNNESSLSISAGNTIQRTLPLPPKERRLALQRELQAFDVHEVPSTLGHGVAWPLPEMPQRSSEEYNDSDQEDGDAPGGIRDDVNDLSALDFDLTSSGSEKKEKKKMSRNLHQPDFRCLAGLQDHLIPPALNRTTRAEMQKGKGDKVEVLMIAREGVARLLVPDIFSGRGAVDILSGLEATLKEGGLEKICAVVLFISAVRSDCQLLHINPLEVCKRIRRSTSAYHFEREYFDDNNLPWEMREQLLDFDGSFQNNSRSQNGSPKSDDDSSSPRSLNSGGSSVINYTENYVCYLQGRWQTELDYALLIALALISSALGLPMWREPVQA